MHLRLTRDCIFSLEYLMDGYSQNDQGKELYLAEPIQNQCAFSMKCINQ
jgi:hypothetical protein